MSGITISKAIKPLVHAAKYCRNGKSPDATFQSEMASLANQAAYIRGKELFRSPGNIAGCPISNSTRNRQYFAFHTSPFCQYVSATMVMAPMSAGKSGFDGFARLTIKDVTTATIGTGDFHFAPVNSGDTPDNFHYGEVNIAVDPDTDYYGFVTDNNEARLLSIAVFEKLLPPDTNNGYVTGTVSVNSPILATDRASLQSIAEAQWKAGAPQSWNWSTEIDTDARVFTAVAADRNIIDNTSTTVTANTPGAYLDMQYKTTLTTNTAGVQCVIAVYAKRTGASGNQGVRLKDSTGTTLVNVSGGWGAAAGWYSQIVFLPATKAKYDLMGWSNNLVFTVYAVSIYEYVP